MSADLTMGMLRPCRECYPLLIGVHLRPKHEVHTFRVTRYRTVRNRRPRSVL